MSVSPIVDICRHLIVGSIGSDRLEDGGKQCEAFRDSGASSCRICLCCLHRQEYDESRLPGFIESRSKTDSSFEADGTCWHTCTIPRKYILLQLLEVGTTCGHADQRASPSSSVASSRVQDKNLALASQPEHRKSNHAFIENHTSWKSLLLVVGLRVVVGAGSEMHN